MAGDALAFLPRLFVVLGAALGISYGLLMPPLQVPDEIGHFLRAYSVSHGTWVAPLKDMVRSLIFSIGTK